MSPHPTEGAPGAPGEPPAHEGAPGEPPAHAEPSRPLSAPPALGSAGAEHPPQEITNLGLKDLCCWGQQKPRKGASGFGFVEPQDVGEEQGSGRGGAVPPRRDGDRGFPPKTRAGSESSPAPRPAALRESLKGPGATRGMFPAMEPPQPRGLFPAWGSTEGAELAVPSPAGCPGSLRAGRDAQLGTGTPTLGEGAQSTRCCPIPAGSFV